MLHIFSPEQLGICPEGFAPLENDYLDAYIGKKAPGAFQHYSEQTCRVMLIERYANEHFLTFEEAKEELQDVGQMIMDDAYNAAIAMDEHINY